MEKVGPDLYEIVWVVVVEKNSGHCRPSKVLRCVCCGDSLVSSVSGHHPFGGCEGHKTCARAQQRIERLGGPMQMLVNEYQYFGCWGGQQEPIHRDMNKSADVVCFVKRMI